MQDKRIVGLRFWGKHSGLAEPVVVVEFRGGTPIGREGRVGHYGVELLIAELIGFERITVADVEIVILNTVQQHIHAAEVEGRRVLLLPENLIGLSAPSRAEKE